MPTEPSTDLYDASPGRRLLALVIDWTLAMAFAWAAFGTGFPPQTPGESFIVQGVFVVITGLTIGFLGVSLGKRLVRLAVVGADGRPIGWWRGLVRTALLSLVIPAIIQRDGRGLHDLAVGSKVIRIGK